MIGYGDKAKTKENEMSKDAQLFKALEKEDLEKIQELLETGAFVKAKGEHGLTALHIAVIHKRPLPIVRALIKAGADVNASDDDGSTPLHYAAGNYAEAVDTLINAGADIEAKDNKALTPLHVAAKYNAPAAQKLIKAGANVNAVCCGVYGSVSFNTPLHEAAAENNLKTAQLLIQAGADISARAKHRDTPLHIAARKGATEIVSLLLKKGADIHAKNEANHTPLDAAQKAFSTAKDRSAVFKTIALLKTYITKKNYQNTAQTTGKQEKESLKSTQTTEIKQESIPANTSPTKITPNKTEKTFNISQRRRDQEDRLFC